MVRYIELLLNMFKCIKRIKRINILLSERFYSHFNDVLGNKGYGKAGHTSYASDDGGIALPADSPVLQMFKSAFVQLNNRHDRHERLVKLSRDITIESKRIIFQLHSAIA